MRHEEIAAALVDLRLVILKIVVAALWMAGWLFLTVALFLSGHSTAALILGALWVAAMVWWSLVIYVVEPRIIGRSFLH